MSNLGEGILKGMAVTAENLCRSFYDPARLTTVEYPEEKATTTQFSRNFPFLVYDGDDPIDSMRCVACHICEKECPPQCIYIVQDKDAQGKALKRAKIFDIDISVCMSCQICVEVCPFEAIKMDNDFELSVTDRFDELLQHREKLLKPNTYFHKIHPIEAAEVDANLAAKAKPSTGTAA